MNQVGKSALYQSYWSTMEPDVRARGWTPGPASTKHHWDFPTGKGSAHWSLNFSQGGLRAELFLKDADPNANLRRLAALQAHGEAIQAALQEQVVFDELKNPDRVSCRVEVVGFGADATVDDETSWPQYRVWMLDRLTCLRAAIAVVGGIPE